LDDLGKGGCGDTSAVGGKMKGVFGKRGREKPKE